LRTELDRLRGELNNAEAELSDYRREHGILSLDGKENTVVERLADLNARLTAAQVSRLSNEAQVHLLRDGGNTTLPSVVADPTIQALKQQLAAVEAEHAKLGATLKPTYPRLVELASQADSLRSRIARETENLAAVVRSQHAAALEEETSLREELEAQRQTALEQKDTTVQYALLVRDLETTRSLHDTVLQRLKEIDLVAETYPSHVYVIDPPERPTAPSFPRYGTSLALSGLIGLLLAIATVMGIETFDRSIRTPREASETLGLPVLASVPDFRRLQEGGLAPAEGELITRVSLSETVATGLDLSPAPESVVTEAYRTVRTNLMLNRRRSESRTILITSACRGEGKTVTALNTAITFSEYAVPVLLIDADFRRPTFQRSLGISPPAGLSEVLSGSASAEDAIVSSQVGLSFLAAGESAAQAGALLGSERMQQLLESLRREYAYILIDGPPVLPVADSVVMSTLVDGVVLVINQPETPRELAEEAQRRLRGVGAKLLGCVLNRVRPDDPTFAPSLREYYG
jgi:capsular exopolysaccharide synthesis family protein